MAGTKEGGMKVSASIRSKYGDDYWSKIGALGGVKGHTGGFYVNRELASIAGRKGGSISKRTKKVLA